MKKQIRKITWLLLIATLSAVLLLSGTLEIYAKTAEEINPYYINVDNTNFNLLVTSSGATFEVNYKGKSTFSRAELFVKLQKKTLGIFWSTVDIPGSDDIWKGSSTLQTCTFFDTLPIDGTGTYRAVFTLNIYGTDGTVEEIEEKVECKYN